MSVTDHDREVLRMLVAHKRNPVRLAEEAVRLQRERNTLRSVLGFAYTVLTAESPVNEEHHVALASAHEECVEEIRQMLWPEEER